MDYSQKIRLNHCATSNGGRRVNDQRDIRNNLCDDRQAALSLIYNIMRREMGGRAEGGGGRLFRKGM